MKNQGLSIFDSESDDSKGSKASEAANGPVHDNERTQVIPVQKDQSSSPASEARPDSAAATAQTPATPAQGTERPAPTRPAPTRPAPAAAVPPPAGAASGATDTFPVVRRNGYDKAQVDARVRQLSGEKAGLSASLVESDRRASGLEAEIEKLRAEVAEAQNPSYAGLGGRASTMLRLAEEEAEEIRGAAQTDAGDIRAQAERDARAIRSDASREAEDMKVVQLRELDETRERLKADAEQERVLAEGEASDLVASAKREAEQLRLAAQQETTEMRTLATRDVEQARAAADREVQEARRTLAVEKERLAREATDHHNSAVAETKRLVEEAERRAAAAEERAGDATKQAGAARAAAKSEAEGVVSRARREAEQIVAAAQQKAEAVASSSDDAHAREIASTKAELDRSGEAARLHHRPAGHPARRRRRVRRGRELSEGSSGRLGPEEPDQLDPSGKPEDAARAVHRAEESAERAEEAASRASLAADVAVHEAEEAYGAHHGGLGEPGVPFARHSPFFIGFVGGLGALLAYFLYVALTSIGSVLVLVVVSMFLAAGLNPSVEFLGRRGLSRGWACTVVIVGVLGTLALFVVAIVPVIGDQVGSLSANAPGWLDRLQQNQRVQELNDNYQIIDKVQDYVANGDFVTGLFGGVLGLGLRVLSTLFNAFVVVVLTLYFLYSLELTKNAFYRLAPASRRTRVSRLGDSVITSVGGYVAGAFVVALSAGLSSLVFLFVVGLGEYAVALAFVVALLDVIPMIGATIGAVVVTAIGFATDVNVGIACIVFYVVYQQVENYVIYPRVMKRSVDVPGAVTVIAALVGAALLGVVGALLAIPTAAAVLLIMREVVVKRQDAR